MHSLLGGFQPKPYHNVGGVRPLIHERNFRVDWYIEPSKTDEKMIINYLLQPKGLQQRTLRNQ
jgi:hypothetical protein